MTTSQPFTATILGIPAIPTIIEVNVRSGPSVRRDLVFKTPLRVQAKINDVQPDSDGSGKDGKLYQWFHVTFLDNRSGWVRDDLVEIIGDGTAFGYPVIQQPQQGFALTRQTSPAAITGSTPQPSQPTAPVSTTPPTPTVTVVTPAPGTTGPTTPAFTPGKARAIAINRSGTRMRSGPGVNHGQVGTIPLLASAEVLGSRLEDGNASPYRWANVNFNGQVGWAREDFLRIEGDRAAFNLGPNDLYPSPMHRCWWVRDFNLDGSRGVIHWGWDLGADEGEPMLAGPQGGTVVRVVRCTRCTPDRPNTPSHGFSIGDSRIINDPAWGWGYGHFVTVRYDHAMLPASTQQSLASRGLAGAHIFALYGHLFSIECQERQVLSPGQRFASCGNTGNSEAPHLHLEIRASTNPNEVWGNMQRTLLDPTIMFRR